jgi:folate-binding protein YgfZ
VSASRLTAPLLSAPLPDEALLHLRGKKIADFLQGQLTCDLRRLAPDRAVRGALCTVKGRVISDLWVLYIDDQHLLVRVRRSLADDFAGHLGRYARFSRISVDHDERRPVVLGVYGHAAPFSAEAPGECRQHDDRVVLRSGTQQSQVIAWDGNPVSGADLRFVTDDAGLADAAAGSAEGWYAAELADGHYAIEAEDRDHYTPQALNYDELGLVAFNKGCYTGQEVVARLHYKGRSKQRLQVYRTAVNAHIDAGGELLRDGVPIGKVLRRARSADGSLVLAALVQAEARGLGAESSGGIALSACTTPPTTGA